jgi:hypothetical protein
MSDLNTIARYIPNGFNEAVIFPQTYLTAFVNYENYTKILINPSIIFHWRHHAWQTL